MLCRLLDHRQQPHAPLAGRTAADVHGKGAGQKLRPPAVSAGRPRLVGLVGGGRRGRRRRDPRSPLAPGREHLRVANRVQAWWRHAGGQAAQQRQRVHVHRHRPVAVRLLQDDAHQAVGAMLQALLRHGRAQHLWGEIRYGEFAASALPNVLKRLSFGRSELSLLSP